MDWPEAVEAGLARVVDTNAEKILYELRKRLSKGVSMEANAHMVMEKLMRKWL
jgi:UDP-N-acetylglucosamine 2-epimerase